MITRQGRWTAEVELDQNTKLVVSSQLQPDAFSLYLLTMTINAARREIRNTRRLHIITVIIMGGVLILSALTLTKDFLQLWGVLH